MVPTQALDEAWDKGLDTVQSLHTVQGLDEAQVVAEVADARTDSLSQTGDLVHRDGNYRRHRIKTAHPIVVHMHLIAAARCPISWSLRAIPIAKECRWQWQIAMWRESPLDQTFEQSTWRG